MKRFPADGADLRGRTPNKICGYPRDLREKKRDLREKNKI